MSNNKGISLVNIIILILLMTILIALIWVGIILMNTSVDNETIADSEQINEEDFDYMLVEYILDSIEVYSSTGYILKDIDGDVTAERLSYEEAKANRAEYKVKIMNMLSNQEIFGKKFKIENKEACTFNFEKILTELGIGTHMGVGIGCTDFEGNKIYIYNNAKIDNAMNGFDFAYFGCNEYELINSILDKIEEHTKKGNIIKFTDKSQLTLEELEDNIEEYKQDILDGVNCELYCKDGIVSCKYLFNEVLLSLKLECTEEGTGMETFIFTDYTLNPRYYQSR